MGQRELCEGQMGDGRLARQAVATTGETTVLHFLHSHVVVVLTRAPSLAAGTINTDV